MAKEYTGSFELTLSDSTRDEVVSCLKLYSDSYLINEKREEGLTELSFSISADIRKEWPEDFLIQIGSGEFYVCIYNLTRQLSEQMLGNITHCFESLNIKYDFEEL